jgi:predicted RNase H-like nuclease (RuvC/YqgF family)
LPGVYLFTLGTVKELRKSMYIDKKYPDNMIICKYGRSDSIGRRMDEHRLKYGKIKGVELKLKFYAFIDNDHLAKAETSVKSFFNNSKSGFEFEECKELVIIEEKYFTEVKKHYSLVENLYSGKYKESINNVKKLEAQIDQIIELNKVKIEALEKENKMLKTEVTDLKTQLTELKKQCSKLENKNEKLMEKNEQLMMEKNEQLKLRNSELEMQNTKANKPKSIKKHK